MLLNRLTGQDGVQLLLLLLFVGGRAFGCNVLWIMIGVALCLGIGGLSMVVSGMYCLDGTGIGGDERFGAKYVPVTLAAGDLAFGGNDGL